MFPATLHSAVLGVRSHDPAERIEATTRLARAYYRPIYKHLRLKWGKSPEDAEDLAQHFFEKAVERDMFAAFEPGRARFRTFVRVCLDRLVVNDHEATTRQKRGGVARAVALDVGDVEAELAERAEPFDADRMFDEEWARTVFSLSVERLERALVDAGKAPYFEVFRRYDLADDKPPYATLAAALGLRETDVTNYLSATRKKLRAIVLEVLRELTADEEEFRQEARELLGPAAPTT